MSPPSSPRPAASRWDSAALRAGASVSLVFAVPAAVIARLVADSAGPGIIPLLYLVFIGGFIVGGGCAAWVQRVGMPLMHGLVAAGATYAAAQAVLIVVELLTGDSVDWFNVIFQLTVVLGAGLIGGFLGGRLRARGMVPSQERAER
ncbi:MAG: hypothetical protein ACO3NQ_08315 [Ilumatobacteraceae bacterium]|jgi:hypothetical protein